MLDVMRRNIKSLAVTLWLVIAAFILFIFIDWGMGRADRTSGKSTVAKVNDTSIYADDYSDAFRMQLLRMKDMFQGRMDRQMIRQFGMESTVIEALVTTELLVQEAKRLGLEVTDADLRDAILNHPSFQENGRFIGRERYERLLMMNRRTAQQFEGELRRDLLTSRLRQLVTMPLTVSDSDVRESYWRTHEKVKLSYISVPAETTVMPELTDAELRAYFDKNKSRFDLPERRKGKYILLEADRIRQQVNLTPRDLESYYNDHIEQFKVEEQAEAQKIVVKWEKRSKDEAKAVAEKLLARVNKGEEFGQVAAADSEDTETSANGGATGPIIKGSLPPSEESALAALSPGQVSGLVESEDSWVVYKLTGRRPATTRTLQEAEPQIRAVLSWEKAREAMDRKIAEILRNAREAKSLEKAAASSGLVVKETPLLAKGDETPGLGDAGQLSQALFSVEKGEIDGPLHVGGGALVYTTSSTETPRPAKYEEVAEKVRVTLSDVKHREQALAKAQQALAEIQAGGKPEEVAKKLGGALHEQEVARNSPLEGIGSSSYIDDQAFSQQPGGPWVGPVAVREGACLFRVVEKKSVAEADFERDKETTRETLLQEKRSRFFESYVLLLRKRNKISLDTQTLAEVNDAILGQFS